MNDQTAPYTDKLRIIPKTHLDDNGEDVIEGYFVQKWKGWSWPFGLWVTDHRIDVVANEQAAIDLCVYYYNTQPIVDDSDYQYVNAN